MEQGTISLGRHVVDRHSFDNMPATDSSNASSQLAPSTSSRVKNNKMMAMQLALYRISDELIKILLIIRNKATTKQTNPMIPVLYSAPR